MDEEQEMQTTICLDQGSLSNAVKSLGDLSEQIETLNGKIESMLDQLVSGFHTTAGYRFKEACEMILLERLKEESKAIGQMAQTLDTAKNQYESVFEEYQQVNQFISSNE